MLMDIYQKKWVGAGVFLLVGVARLDHLCSRNPMRIPHLLFPVFALLVVKLPAATETLRLPLSGQGPSDAVEWDFQVSEGRRAGEQAKIPVPSQWEQHGFGNYDYGNTATKDKHKEDGLYRRDFTVPEEWRGMRVRIIFDGSMTDTTVTVNGQQAGPIHQGAFYRFHHDITDKIKFGATNHLEALVSKDSANSSVEEAERGADYWVFGGIFRPVWLEARPPQSIEWTAVDAKADGAFSAKVHLEGEGKADRVIARVLSLDGKLMGTPVEAPVKAGEPVELSGLIPGIKPWCAEEPNLYQIEFLLESGGKVLHRTIERVGFRTMEVRQGEGVFVNGKRITVKGIDRHCFRPESGRALDPKDSVDDVRLIQSMNMNAVRCSHYSPDEAFLKACDELGLYVIDELCTWQKPVLDTPSARRLIGELIMRDVNHPSILWWANGNEGGWNTEVDGDYALWDIQRRPVLHPWEAFSGFQTKHYPRWDRLQKDLASGLLVMPTEYLHGLFDGGHGAGLEDYWNAITSRPNGVGGFLWVLADEGIMRTDQGGKIDVAGIQAPDGIVGPHHEKEASYFTAKDIFCPASISMKMLPDGFGGNIPISNKYDFRNLSTCKFSWKLTDIGGKEQAHGELPGPDVAAGQEGVLALTLPKNWNSSEILELTAIDRDGMELWTWSWPTRGMARSATAVAGKVGISEPDANHLRVTAAGNDFLFNRTNGLLEGIKANGVNPGLANGPRLVGLDPVSTEAFTVQQGSSADGAVTITAESKGPFTSFVWKITPDGGLSLAYRYQIDQPVNFHGITFDLPESGIRKFAWTGQGPERVWANRMRGIRFGSFTREFRKLQPGHDFDYPHTAGFYAGIREASIGTKTGTIHVTCQQGNTFLRVGTNDEGERVTTHWPAGDFSVLHAIPAIGNKFDKPEVLGPQSEPHPAGVVTGKVEFHFEK